MYRLFIAVVALCTLAECQYNAWQSQPWETNRPVRQYWPQQQVRQYYPQEQQTRQYYPQEPQARQYYPQEPQPQYWQQQPQQQQQPEPYLYQQGQAWPGQQQTQLYFSGAPEVNSRFPQAQQYRAIAKLTGATVNGNVTFTQEGDGPVRLQGDIVGLSDGKVGFHVHEKGDLSGGCLTLGGHFNPNMATHGAPEDRERHVGDLGNIESRYGRASIDIVDSLLSLHGANSIVGRGLVVHSAVDDLGRGGHPDSKKTGNAGGRVSCGVIGIIDAPNSSATILTSGILLGSCLMFVMKLY